MSVARIAQADPGAKRSETRSKSNQTFWRTLMASKKTVLSLALASAVGSAFLAVPAAHSAGDPFAMQSLEKGYMVAEMKDGTGKTINKAKEAKCGGDKAKEAKCGGDKAKEAKCGGDKAKEGKCGGDKAKEGKCGGDKKKEGKCGEGKCGGSK
jgi:uncharacterized low-complexity protein